MRIGIAGAGAVGCHYASLMTQAGVNVICLTRGAHLEAMRERGLLHVSNGREQRVMLAVDDDPAVLAGADIVLLTCKMTTLASLLGDIRAHLKDSALIVTLQNGVQAPEMACRAFPRHAIVAGTAFIGARVERPGVIVHSAAGGIRIGRWQPGPGERHFQALLAALDAAGVAVREEPAVQKMLWRKLLWNCGFNAITAVTRHYARDMAANEETLRIVRQAMEETVNVGRAGGIDIGEEDIRKHIQVTLEMGPVKTSMWQDLERGRPTEVDYINGFVADRGDEYGVATPVNRMLTALVHALER